MAKAPILHDPESEKALVSTVMASFVSSPEPLAKALGIVSEAWFMVPQARETWAAMRRVYEAGETLNPLSVKMDLENHGKLNGVGGFSGLTDLFAFNEFGSVDFLLERLRELYERRCMDRLGYDLRLGSADLMREPSEIRSEICTKLVKLELGNRDATVRTGLDLLTRLTDFKPFRPSDGSQKLMHFPFAEWNDQVECAPGHVILLGARPKVGKSALTIDTMVCTAMQGRRPMLISLEMDNDEVEARLAARLTGYNSRMFLAHNFEARQVQQAMDKADAVGRMSWWCHHSGVAWSRVEAEIRERVRTAGVECVMIDYFTLIGKPTGQKGATDSTLWGQLSMAIKRIAQELRICILLVAQLNREGAEVEPHAHNFRETGQLEQDANAIIMLWKNAEGKIWGKVSENRSGLAVGKRVLTLDGGANKFHMEPQETSPATTSQGEFKW